MEQFKQFSIEKQAAIDSLLQLRGMLEALGEMEIDIGDDLQKYPPPLPPLNLMCCV